MAQEKTTPVPSASRFTLFDAPAARSADGPDELPKDETGRSKIKQQYVELLGIRMAKLRGRILNRERINKTLEGIYFICGRCENVCHNLDEGLVEDEENKNNLCEPCHAELSAPVRPARAKPKPAVKAKTKAKPPTKTKVDTKAKAKPSKSSKVAPVGRKPKTTKKAAAKKK